MPNRVSLPAPSERTDLSAVSRLFEPLGPPTGTTGLPTRPTIPVVPVVPAMPIAPIVPVVPVVPLAPTVPSVLAAPAAIPTVPSGATVPAAILAAVPAPVGDESSWLRNRDPMALGIYTSVPFNLTETIFPDPPFRSVPFCDKYK